MQHLYKDFSNFFIANNYKSSLELVSSQQLGRQNTCYIYFKEDYDISVRLVSVILVFQQLPTWTIKLATVYLLILPNRNFLVNRLI